MFVLILPFLLFLLFLSFLGDVDEDLDKAEGFEFDFGDVVLSNDADFRLLDFDAFAYLLDFLGVGVPTDVGFAFAAVSRFRTTNGSATAIFSGAAIGA